MSHHHEGCCKHEGQPRHEAAAKVRSQNTSTADTVTSMNTVNAAVVATVAGGGRRNVSLVTVNCVLVILDILSRDAATVTS